ncbi:hypothetical protein V6N13_138431 [Hibiscus sabdariffa]
MRGGEHDDEGWCKEKPRCFPPKLSQMTSRSQRMVARVESEEKRNLWVTVVHATDGGRATTEADWRRRGKSKIVVERYLGGWLNFFFRVKNVRLNIKHIWLNQNS